MGLLYQEPYILEYQDSFGRHSRISTNGNTFYNNVHTVLLDNIS